MPEYPIISADELLRRYDGTQPPDYAVGDLVERRDRDTGVPDNEFVVTGIYSPGTRPPGSFTRYDQAWYAACRYEDNRPTPYNAPVLWLACRLQKRGTPRPIPKTNHKIGVPKNKLP